MEINWVMQIKGGVGKSYVAATMAEYHLRKGVTPICVDLDPGNPTFSAYKTLNAETMDIMEDDEVNPRAFDILMTKIHEIGLKEAKAKNGNKKDTTPAHPEVMVVDIGASSFQPICAYMIQSGIMPWLKEQGHDIRIHTVIVGNQELENTVKCYDYLCRNFEEANVYVWLNEFFGEVLRNGRGFEQSQAYEAFKKQTRAVLKIPRSKAALLGRDQEKRLANSHLYQDVLNNPAYEVMERHRLGQFFGKLNEQMTEAL